jgi:mono/diheme cytochrome c family protein
MVFPPPPSWLTDDAQSERHAAAGQRTFQTVCAACHGTKGDGNGPAAAGLKDIVGEPAPPADLRQPHLRSGDAPEDIYRVLMTGLNGTPMVSFAETFTPDQKWDLVAYILKLRRDFSALEKDQAAKP